MRRVATIARARHRARCGNASGSRRRPPSVTVCTATLLSTPTTRTCELPCSSVTARCGTSSASASLVSARTRPYCPGRSRCVGFGKAALMRMRAGPRVDLAVGGEECAGQRIVRAVSERQLQRGAGVPQSLRRTPVDVVRNVQVFRSLSEKYARMGSTCDTVVSRLAGRRDRRSAPSRSPRCRRRATAPS